MSKYGLRDYKLKRTKKKPKKPTLPAPFEWHPLEWRTSWYRFYRNQYESALPIDLNAYTNSRYIIWVENNRVVSYRPPVGSKEQCFDKYNNLESYYWQTEGEYMAFGYTTKRPRKGAMVIQKHDRWYVCYDTKRGRNYIEIERHCPR